MSVFWFGWAKKLKNIFTKQQADQYYLQKNSNQLQQVSGLVDFTSNIVCKRNGYVDNVDTNGPTSMINKRYLEEQTLSKTSTSAQTVAGPVSLHSPIELGTEIKAGYGGGTVKFIPEDNSTKTLQFYNGNATDIRRFNLLVPNPTQAQNPATKQYVDNNTLPKSFEAAINEVKRLTTLKTYNYSGNNAATNWSVTANIVDFTRPVYISFKQSNYDSGAILKSYNYVVNFLEENNWYYLNDNVSIKYFSRNNSYTIEWKSANLPSREVLGYITLKYTPKTL